MKLTRSIPINTRTLLYSPPDPIGVSFRLLRPVSDLSQPIFTRLASVVLSQVKLSPGGNHMKKRTLIVLTIVCICALVAFGQNDRKKKKAEAEPSPSPSAGPSWEDLEAVKFQKGPSLGELVPPRRSRSRTVTVLRAATIRGRTWRQLRIPT